MAIQRAVQGDLVESQVEPIRVGVASPQRFDVEALGRVLSIADDIRIVAVHDSLEAALQGEEVDLLLVDASLKSPERLDSASSGPASRLLVVGVDSPQQVILWAQVGIVGYVPKHESLAGLASAIRLAAAGEAVCSRRMAAALFRRIAEMHRSARPTSVSQLTDRERSILECIAMGHSNKRISRDLGLSSRCGYAQRVR